MGRSLRDFAGSADDELLDDHYFTYRPLSNLPTPPPSSRNSTADQSPSPPLEEGEELQGKFLGPAIHLVNLLPPSASLANPSVSLVQALLARTELPLETVALAVCILDSLDSKFALSWRLQCPLVVPPEATGAGSSPSKRHSLADGLCLLQAGGARAQLHIDSVQPELIILAALVIAAKFSDDRSDPTSFYCAAWGRNVWSCAQLNVTERVIYQNLGWRIKPLADDEDLIAETLVDMQLAARQCRGGFFGPSPAVSGPARSNRRLAPPAWQDLGATGRALPGAAMSPGLVSHGKSKSMSVGTAVVGLGLQLTPVDTPLCEADGANMAAGGDYLTYACASSLSSWSASSQGLPTVGEEADLRHP